MGAQYTNHVKKFYFMFLEFFAVDQYDQRDLININLIT